MKEFPPIRPMHDLRVLVVDTQTLVHQIIQNVLRDVGVKTVVCTQNAFRALRECEVQTFDIVVLAFNVSHDKDGFHLYEELRLYNHITDKTTVIFLSAETSPQLVNCVIELQPHDFWVKPLDNHRVEQRLQHLFATRRTFHKLTCCLEVEDYAAAIYQADRLLGRQDLKEFHNKLRRIKGDCLIKLFAFADAEQYYRQLSERYDAGWVKVGLLKSLLKQDKSEESEAMFDKLVTRDDTKFQTYDLLAQHHIRHTEYDKAYEKMQRACELAPRNMNRNKKLWDLARLNHDRLGQLKAVQAMAHYAKNSIHDSPILKVNVIRASIDLASTMNSEDGVKLAKKAEEMLEGLQKQKAKHPELNDVLVIAEARMASLNSDKNAAEKILKDHEVSTQVDNVEDGLDKMKVFHELGMREQCMSILESLKSIIAGDEFSSNVVNAYIEQEEIERGEVNFTAKELKQMAATHFSNNRFEPALDLLRQAHVLSPSDSGLALNILKVMAEVKKACQLNEQQEALLTSATQLLGQAKLSDTQRAKFEEYSAALAA